MREPTYDPLAWWRASLSDPRHPRHEGEPQAGFFRRRAVKGGPWIPVKITLIQNVDGDGFLTEDERFQADEMGRRVDPLRIWTSCRPVTEEEYLALLERHQSIEPMAATHARFDLSRTPILPGE